MKRYLIALGIGLLIIVGMTLIAQYMEVLVEEQAALGVKVISFPEIILLRIVAQWLHWRIFLIPFCRFASASPY